MTGGSKNDTNTNFLPETGSYRNAAETCLVKMDDCVESFRENLSSASKTKDY